MPLHTKTCTKVWADIPFAHRAPNHDGHCSKVHGHNWSFSVTFGLIGPIRVTDENGFVVDFGKLTYVKDWLTNKFDHALVLNQDDPLRLELTNTLLGLGINNVTVVPDCSCEGLAEYAALEIGTLVRQATSDRVCVVAVTLTEDSKNSATYTAP